MSLVHNDRAWIDVIDFLKSSSQPSDLILAPNDCLEVFGNVSSYNVSDFLAPERFRFVVIHIGMIELIDRDFLWTVISNWTPTFANDVFVVFSPEAPTATAFLRNLLPSARRRKLQVELQVQHLLRVAHEHFPPKNAPAVETDAIVLTTYNRNWALSCSLPSAAAFGIPVLVVDDGSNQDELEKNRETCRLSGAQYLHMPENRGLPCALNAGLSYFLADPAIGWIGVMQDDVQLAPDTFKALTAVRHPRERPILTPYFAKEHIVHGHANIEGYDVVFQRSAPGLMLYAHRDYWRDIMPIPTPHLGAPKGLKSRPGQGADEDWWITAWAPRSAPKRGLYVTCIPDLAKHLAEEPALSTWRNLDLQ